MAVSGIVFHRAQLPVQLGDGGFFFFEMAGGREIVVYGRNKGFCVGISSVDLAAIGLQIAYLLLVAYHQDAKHLASFLWMRTHEDRKLLLQQGCSLAAEGMRMVAERTAHTRGWGYGAGKWMENHAAKIACFC